MDVSSQEVYRQSFESGGYLFSRFNEIHPIHNQFTLGGLHDLYSSKYRERTDLKVLEIGCGPAIAYQISAAPHASEIVMAEPRRNSSLAGQEARSARLGTVSSLCCANTGG